MIKEIPNDIFEELETKSVYKGYVERQLQDIRDLKKDEELKIPRNLNYNSVPNLTTEVLEKLNDVLKERLFPKGDTCPNCSAELTLKIALDLVHL